jgi:hypothetical protein
VVVTTGHDVGAATDVGRVDVYYGGLGFADDVTAERSYVGTADKTLKTGVGAADLNGDGYDDLILPVCPPAPTTCNAAVYFGGPIVLPTAANATIANQDGLTAVGDLNADGYEDLVAYRHNCSLNGTDCAGEAFVIAGGPTNTFSAKKLMPGAGYSGERFGRRRTAVGDVNKDGFDDFVLGDHLANTFRGSWFLYLGGASLDAVSDRGAIGPEEYSMFGFEVCGGGDLNGDGFSDFAQGMQGSVDDGVDVFFGAASPPSAAGRFFREDALPDDLGGTCSL